MIFVLIMSVWANSMTYPYYYRLEMPKSDCEAMLKVINQYPKVASPDIHAICVPKGIDSGVHPEQEKK